MLIHAATKSKGWKRGAEKKIAEILKVGSDLRDMCGSLHLDALTVSDVALLTQMYCQVFSQYGEARGSIVVKDAAGKVVIEYGYHATPAAPACGDATSVVAARNPEEKSLARERGDTQ